MSTYLKKCSRYLAWFIGSCVAIVDYRVGQLLTYCTYAKMKQMDTNVLAVENSEAQNSNVTSERE